MGAAPLPGCAGQGRGDRVDQPAVGVAGDELDPAQAAGAQVAEEPQPPGAVLAGGDLDPEDLAVAVGVHAGGDQGVDRDDPAALTDLEDQRVGGHERERARVLEPAGAELLDVAVEVLGHLADLATWTAS